MKLNKQRTIKEKLYGHKHAKTNKEGALAFKLDSKTRLFQRVLTCLFGEDKFYGNQDSKIIANIKQVAKKDPEYVLKLAVYARNEMYLRTVPQVLLVECANNEHFKGTALVRQYTPLIVRRADEIMEVLAFQLKNHKKPIPNSLIRGLKDTFTNFDEYQFSKYNRKGEVKLKDAVKLVHPKPLDKERAVLYKRILDDELATPDTWEVVISTQGSNKENWEKIIPKMGYMALLRNLRNFLKNDVDLEPVIKRLTDEKEVLKSKQLPFRFFSAYKEIEKTGGSGATKLMDTILDALDISCKNLPKITGTTFMSSDISGSMKSTISAKSSISMKDIACLMQGIAHGFCDNVMTSAFGTSFKEVPLSKRSSILDKMKALENSGVGWSTNGYLVPRYLRENKIKVDRIMVFTDEEMWDSNEWRGSYSFAEEALKYRREVNPDAYFYIFNLNGYGETVLPQDTPKTALISGWSEKVLKFVELYERDQITMLKEIEGYHINTRPVQKG